MKIQSSVNSRVFFATSETHCTDFCLPKRDMTLISAAGVVLGFSRANTPMVSLLMSGFTLISDMATSGLSSTSSETDIEPKKMSSLQTLLPGALVQDFDHLEDYGTHTPVSTYGK